MARPPRPARHARAARVARVARVASLMVGVALALVACGGTPASVPPVTPVPSGVVALDAKEYAFTPATLSVPAGSVTFSVRNVGTEAHEFEVLTGDQSLAKVAGVAAGATGELTVSLVAGQYTFACRLNGHDQLGMKGTLTVTGG